MASSRQASFAQVEWSGRKRQTARARFLEQMDSVVPWADIVALVEPHRPCASGRGRQPWPTETMLRMFLVQAWPSLSDEGCEDVCYDSLAVRDFVGSTQNEPHLTWNGQMLGHVRAMMHWRNSLPPGEPPDPAEVAAMEARYDEILALAEADYAGHPPTKYYRDGYNLFVRMRDYRGSHLLFLHDTRAEPDNSLCERKARVFKRRQHASICFRSFENLGHVCDGIATVDNMRSGGKDVFAESSLIFARPRATASASD